VGTRSGEKRQVLTAKKQRAAILLAEDELTDEAIAAEVGIGTRTLRHWKRDPAFSEAVRDHTATLNRAISRFSVAKRRKRVQTLQRLADACLQIIEARAADPDFRRAPGGTSGLLTHDVKVIGYGDNARKVDVYRVDTALSAELRNILRQAAQEVGQWSERYEIPGMGRDETSVVFYLPRKGSHPEIFPNGPPPEWAGDHDAPDE
jgi:hypothetical protein